MLSKAQMWLLSQLLSVYIYSPVFSAFSLCLLFLWGIDLHFFSCIFLLVIIQVYTEDIYWSICASSVSCFVNMQPNFRTITRISLINKKTISCSKYVHLFQNGNYSVEQLKGAQLIQRSWVSSVTHNIELFLLCT